MSHSLSSRPRGLEYKGAPWFELHPDEDPRIERSALSRSASAFAGAPPEDMDPPPAAPWPRRTFLAFPSAEVERERAERERARREEEERLRLEREAAEREAERQREKDAAPPPMALPAAKRKPRNSSTSDWAVVAKGSKVRQHLRAAQEICDIHALHRSWVHLRRAFEEAAPPPDKDMLLATLTVGQLHYFLETCPGAGITEREISRAFGRLPAKWHDAKSDVLYTEFVTVFGVRGDDGTVAEPLLGASFSRPIGPAKLFDGGWEIPEFPPEWLEEAEEESRKRSLTAKSSTRLMMIREKQVLLDLNSGDEMTLRSEIRVLAAVVVQATGRGYLARRTNATFKAILFWKQFRDRSIRAVLEGWHKVAFRSKHLGRLCRRPLFMWRLTVVKRLLKERTFRLGFWPLHTWRRWAQRKIYTRGKIQSLLRIYETWVRIVHFRGWKKWFRSEVKGRLQSNAAEITMIEWRQRQFLWHWVTTAKRRRQIRDIYNFWGRPMRQMHIFRSLGLPFSIWRYYASSRALCRQRGRTFWRTVTRTHGKPSSIEGNARSGGEDRRGGRDRGGSKDRRRRRSSASRGRRSSASEGSARKRRLPQVTCDKFLVVPYFPRPTEMEWVQQWSEEVVDDVASRYAASRVVEALLGEHTEDLYSMLLRKDARTRVVNYAVYCRLAPKCFRALCDNADLARRKRYGVFLGCQCKMRHAICRWLAASRYYKSIRTRPGKSEGEGTNDTTAAAATAAGSETAAAVENGAVGAVAVVGEPSARGGDGSWCCGGCDGMVPNDILRCGGCGTPQPGSMAHNLLARNERRMKLKAEAEQRWKDDEEWRKVGTARQADLSLFMGERRAAMQVELMDRNAALLKGKSLAGEKATVMQGVMDGEADDTDSRRSAMLDHVRDVQRRRARILHDVLCSVIDAHEATSMRTLCSSILRHLRVLVLQSRSVASYRRARLRNWCRLCGRYRYLYRAMPLYHRLRTMWSIWKRWLRLVEMQYMDGPDRPMRKDCKLRQARLPAFSLFLVEEERAQAALPPARRRKPGVDAYSCRMDASFLRWVEYTHKRVTRERIVDAAVRRRALRTTRYVFHCIRLVIKLKYQRCDGGRGDDVRSSDMIHQPSLLERRCVAEIDLWRTRVLVGTEARLFSDFLRRKHAWLRARIKEKALSQDTIKRAEERWQVECDARLALERRLLFAEFRARGTHRFVDREMHHGGGGSVKSSTLVPFSDSPVPKGTMVVAITVHVKSKLIVGIAMDCCHLRGNKSIPGAVRGAANTGGGSSTCGASTQVFYLDKKSREELFAIEGYISEERGGIGALRFLTSSGRISHWYGDLQLAPGNAAKLVRGGVAAHAKTLVPFRIGGEDIENEAIIGFCGTQRAPGIGGDGYLAMLGAVVRRYTSRGLFWRCWLSHGASQVAAIEDNADGIDTDESKAAPPVVDVSERDPRAGVVDERQFLQLLRIRACDIVTACQRGKDLARRMRTTAAHVPHGLDSMRVAIAMGRWCFEALTRGLVHEPREVGRGADLVERGEGLVRKGEVLLAHGRHQLAQIIQYKALPDGRHDINVGVLGDRKAQVIHTAIAAGENNVNNGQSIVDSGDELIRAGQALMPQIPRTGKFAEYFENLYHLAVLSDTVVDGDGGTNTT